MNSLATPLFHLDGRSFKKGRHHVLHDIRLTIQPGEKVALIGPSGAGKSSLLEWLYQQQASQIALCPQDNGLVDILSVYQNIYMGGLERHSAFHNLTNLIKARKADKEEIQHLAETLGIGDKLWHSMDKLSGGQRQRVAIGRALYRKKSVFFGDEPVSALDPEQARHILKYLISEHDTLVVSLHNRRLALDYFDRIIALKGGHISYDGPVVELSAHQLDRLYVQ